MEPNLKKASFKFRGGATTGVVKIELRRLEGTTVGGGGVSNGLCQLTRLQPPPLPSLGTFILYFISAEAVPHLPKHSDPLSPCLLAAGIAQDKS